MRVFHQLEVQNSLPLLQHNQLPAVTQVCQLKEGLQNNHPPQQNQEGGLPNIKNQENVPPGGGVGKQPEDEGQEDSPEGAETAGPLT